MTSGLFRLKDWFILGPMGAIAFALGVVGFLSCGHCGVTSLGDAALDAFGLIRGTGHYVPGTDPIELVIAQYLLPAVAIFGGAKLFLVNLRRDMRVALARRSRDHIIVCGLDDNARQIVESLREAGKTTIAIAPDGESANALACERIGATVLAANPQRRNILELANLKRAEAIVAVTGSDAQNLEIGLLAAEMAKGRSGAPLKIVAETRSNWLIDNLRAHRTAVLGGEGVEFQVFSIRDNSARALTRSDAFERAFARAGDRPRLAMAGFGDVAMDIVRHAIGSNFALPGVRLSVTVFSRDVTASRALFKSRWPGLEAEADFDFHASTFAPGDADVWAEVEKTLAENRADAVAVSLGTDDETLRTALLFRDVLDRLEQSATPVFVRLGEQRKLGAFLRRLEAYPDLPDRLVPFGDLHELTAPAILLDQEHDRMARAAHEAYLKSVSRTESSPANVAWSRLPERFKASNRAFADHIPAALRTAGFKLARGSAHSPPLDAATLDTLARAEHWRWCIEQRSQGWSFGEKRSEVLKHSPLITEWEKLPEEARALNREMAARIPEIVQAAGFEIRKAGANP